MTRTVARLVLEEITSADSAFSDGSSSMPRKLRRDLHSYTAIAAGGDQKKRTIRAETVRGCTSLVPTNTDWKL